MPVMTMACGTGSNAKPAAAPRRATIPKTRKTPQPIEVEGQQFAQGMRVKDEAVKPEADQAGADQTRENGGGHGSRLPLGGPATSIGKATAMDSSMNASMNRMIGLAKAGG